MPKPLPPGLEVRQARPEDLQSLAELLAGAPDDGMAYKYPRLAELKETTVQLYLNWLPSVLYDTELLIRVAVLPASAESGGQPTIVGFSQWAIQEIDPETKESKQIAQFPGRAPTGEAPPPPPDAEDRAAAVRAALEPDPPRAAAVSRVRSAPQPSSPSGRIPRFWALEGLAVHADYTGCGIGSLLVRWGLERAAAEGLPLFSAGEEQGVSFYVKALGFRKLKGSEYWLDSAGNDVDRAETDKWSRANGGLSGANVVWCPPGYVLPAEVAVVDEA